MLRTFGVSSMISTTSPRPSSVARVPLLSPWIAVDVVAVGLPEPGLVVIHQPQTPHPLRALPEIQVRNEEPSGASVLGLERRAAIGEGDLRLPVEQVFEPEIRGVVAVGEDHPNSSQVSMSITGMEIRCRSGDGLVVG
jgi:hypothetical protein